MPTILAIFGLEIFVEIIYVSGIIWAICYIIGHLEIVPKQHIIGDIEHVICMFVPFLVQFIIFNELNQCITMLCVNLRFAYMNNGNYLNADTMKLLMRICLLIILGCGIGLYLYKNAYREI